MVTDRNFTAVFSGSSTFFPGLIRAEVHVNKVSIFFLFFSERGVHRFPSSRTGFYFRRQLLNKQTTPTQSILYPLSLFL